MWQRIQTLYLAIATILCACMFFMTKAITLGQGGDIDLEIKFTQYVPYLVLIIVLVFLHIVALASAKNLVFQLRTCTLSAIVALAFQVWLVVDFLATRGEVIFRIGAVFPIIIMILDLMAARRVLADRLLIESANHLRASKRGRRK